MDLTLSKLTMTIYKDWKDSYYALFIFMYAELDSQSSIVFLAVRVFCYLYDFLMKNARI